MAILTSGTATNRITAGWISSTDGSPLAAIWSWTLHRSIGVDICGTFKGVAIRPPEDLIRPVIVTLLAHDGWFSGAAFVDAVKGMGRRLTIDGTFAATGSWENNTISRPKKGGLAAAWSTRR